MTNLSCDYRATSRAALSAIAALLLTVSVAGHIEPAAVSDAVHGKAAAHESRYAPSKPMAVVHFVKHARFAASGGETLKVRITVLASQDVETLVLEAKAEPGLALLNSPSRSVGPVKAGSEVTVTFDVTALAEGRRYVNLVATANSDSGRHLSSYSLPIEVGTVGARLKSSASKAVVEDDQGNRLILMPAVKPADPSENR